MINLDIYAYITLIFIIINTIFLYYKQTNIYIYIINAIFIELIVMISMVHSGIMADQFNLSGSSTGMIILIINFIIITMASIIYVLKNK